MKHFPYKSILKWGGRVALAPFLLWMLGLWLYRPETLIPAIAAAALWGILLRCGKLSPQNARRQRWLWALAACMVVTYIFLPGPSDVVWQKPWQQSPQPTLSGNILTIKNLRDFRYRSEDDFDVRYRSESYDLDTLTGASFVESHWDGMELICHTMLSFDFADGRHLVVSPETRLPVGEVQNAIGGIYKRYGLLYVFGTEEDILALRTNYRHEDMLLLPLRISPEQARAMLLQLVAEAQRAEGLHQSYNTVTANCSTGILSAFISSGIVLPRGYRLLPVHNGSISEVLYRNKLLCARPEESYDAMRSRCYLRYDIAPDAPQDYSPTIRNMIED